MRHSITRFVAAVLVGTIINGVALAQHIEPTDYKRSNGNLRLDHPTAVPSIQGTTPYRQPTNSVPNTVTRYPVYQYPRYNSPYRQDYGYYPSYDGYYQQPSYYYPRRYYRGYRYPTPVFVPAETLYGPQAVKRFMGVAP